MIFKNYDARPVHIVNLAVRLFDDMRNYNFVSSIFLQCFITAAHTNSTKEQIDSIWNQPPEDWVKFNTDASKQVSTRSAPEGYVMRDNHIKIIMVKG